MDRKIILLTSGFGSVIGGYIPGIFGAAGLNGWSILGAFVGGIIGIWIGIKINTN